MKNLCYIHNDGSVLKKDSILISKASATFSVCRANDVIFKISKCGMCYNNIHFCIKNCNCKIMRNVKIRLKLNNCDGYLYKNIKDICPGEIVMVSRNIDKCNNMPVKIYSELLIGEDVIKNACIVV